MAAQTEAALQQRLDGDLLTTLETRALQLWNARPWHSYTCCKGCGEMKNCTAERRPNFLCLTCWDLGGGK